MHVISFFEDYLSRELIGKDKKLQEEYNIKHSKYIERKLLIYSIH